MLTSLRLRGVGPATELELDPLAPRLNLITGDNGLGKSFLLDLAWWALTKRWAGEVAAPRAHKAPSIVGSARGDDGEPYRFGGKWAPNLQEWFWGNRHPNNVIVLYARADASYVIFDLARNHTLRMGPDSRKVPPTYKFSSEQVWHGVPSPGNAHAMTCDGLIRDWVRWQQASMPQFDNIVRLLATLGPEGEPLRPGDPVAPSLFESTLVPTVRMPYGIDVPITYAPAGVRRMAQLAYLLTWVTTEHARAAAALGVPSARRIVILFDEPENHLHPRWQRTILPSLMEIARVPGQAAPAQFFVATHSPLVLASMESSFDPSQDALWKLDLDTQHGARIERDHWHPRGDVNDWLTSDVFDLGMARSREAESAIHRIRALMRESSPSEADLRAADAALVRVVSDSDVHLRRWRAYLEERGIQP